MFDFKVDGLNGTQYQVTRNDKTGQYKIQEYKKDKNRWTLTGEVWYFIGLSSVLRKLVDLRLKHIQARSLQELLARLLHEYDNLHEYIEHVLNPIAREEIYKHYATTDIETQGSSDTTNTAIPHKRTAIIKKKVIGAEAPSPTTKTRTIQRGSTTTAKTRTLKRTPTSTRKPIVLTRQH